MPLTAEEKLALCALVKHELRQEMDEALKSRARADVDERPEVAGNTGPTSGEAGAGEEADRRLEAMAGEPSPAADAARNDSLKGNLYTRLQALKRKFPERLRQEPPSAYPHESIGQYENRVFNDYLRRYSPTYQASDLKAVHDPVTRMRNIDAAYADAEFAAEHPVTYAAMVDDDSGLPIFTDSQPALEEVRKVDVAGRPIIDFVGYRPADEQWKNGTCVQPGGSKVPGEPRGPRESWLGAFCSRKQRLAGIRNR